MIATLCEHLDTLDEPEAKASMIWIIGEYAERIDNADELLEYFLETFPEESGAVQMQLVTATVKLFLKKPLDRPQQMIQLVLTYATQVKMLLSCLSDQIFKYVGNWVHGQYNTVLALRLPEGRFSPQNSKFRRIRTLSAAGLGISKALSVRLLAH